VGYWPGEADHHRSVCWGRLIGVIDGSAASEAHAFIQGEIMKKQLIRISVLQSSKIMTALYVLMGFIYTLIGIPMAIFGGEQVRLMGVIYLLMPVIMGILGFVFFVIFAAIYNLLAEWLGGVEVEVKNIE
jgi:hypothetical protein